MRHFFMNAVFTEMEAFAYVCRSSVNCSQPSDAHISEIHKYFPFSKKNV